MKRIVPTLCLSGVLSFSASAQDEVPEKKPSLPTYLTADEADAAGPGFSIQGEYTIQGEDRSFGIQIWAMGSGAFEAVAYEGGLPGAGWNQDRETVSRTPGAWEEALGAAVFVTENQELRAEVRPGGGEVFSAEGERLFEMSREVRQSPTLGEPPPEGAVVLFDEESNRFPGSRVTEDGLLMEGATSEPTFEDFSLHIEFRLPYKPEARGQKRGNSGIYLQGRYEVQMLDSFGLEGADNECGGLYKIAAPAENLCFPPLTWQTYDIDFTSARWDDDGNKTSNASITVRHNGAIIHENQELPGHTTAAPLTDGPEPGPIYLQNHGNPVRYRNIWVLPRK